MVSTWEQRLAEQRKRRFDHFEPIELSLDTARTNERFPVAGDGLHVVELSAGASIDVRLNHPNNPPITISRASEIDQIAAVFTDIYITHTAQAGESVKLLAGIDFDLKKKQYLKRDARYRLSRTDIVDVEVYPVAADYDSGAWIAGSEYKGWFADLGRFPAVSVMLAATASFEIYSLDHREMNKFCVFDQAANNILGASATPSVVRALNGEVFLATADGLIILNFISDVAYKWDENGLHRYNGGIADRNSGAGWRLISTVNTLGDDLIRALAVKAETDAPLHTATGMPVPTVAAGCWNGGCYVINNDGSLANLRKDTDDETFSILFLDSGAILQTLYVNNQVLRHDSYASDDTTPDAEYTESSTPALSGKPSNNNRRGLIQTNSGVVVIGTDAAGINFLSEDLTTQANGMIAYVLHNYITGWMPGDIDICVLTEVSPVEDRSGQSNDLSAGGSPTHAPVEPGAEVYGVSGFDDTNRYFRAADFCDYGTDSFCVLAWVKANSVSDRNTIAQKSNSGATVQGCWTLELDAAGQPNFILTDDGYSTTDTINAGFAIDDGRWHLICAVKTSNTDLDMYIDGAKATATVSVTNATGNISSGDAGDYFWVGTAPDGSLRFTGTISHLRVSRIAPSAKQIEQMFQYEVALYKPHAKALLGGTTSEMGIVKHDEKTDIVLVSTADGLALFDGFARVDYIDTAKLLSDTMRVSAGVDNLVVAASDQEVYIDMPAEFT